MELILQLDQRTKLITKKKKKAKIRLECLGISYSYPNRDRACYALANTLQLAPPCSLKICNVLKPVRDGLDKTYFINLFEIRFLAPFSFQTAQCCKCPDTDKKKRQEQGF